MTLMHKPEDDQAQEELASLRRSWVDPIERAAYKKYIGEMLRARSPKRGKRRSNLRVTEEIVAMFELHLGNQAATQQVMCAIQDSGWNVDGPEPAWDYVKRIARERNEALADCHMLIETIRTIASLLGVEAQALIEDPSIVNMPRQK